MLTFLHRNTRRYIAAIQHAVTTHLKYPDCSGRFSDDPMVVVGEGGRLDKAPAAKVTNCTVWGTLIIEDGCTVSNVVVQNNTTVIIKRGSTVLGAAFSGVSDTPAIHIIDENSFVMHFIAVATGVHIRRDALILEGVIQGGIFEIGEHCVMLAGHMQSANMSVGKELVLFNSRIDAYRECTNACVGDNVCIAPYANEAYEKPDARAEQILTAVSNGEGVAASPITTCQFEAPSVYVANSVVMATGCCMKAHKQIVIGEGSTITSSTHGIGGSFALRLISGDIRIGKKNQLIKQSTGNYAAYHLGDTEVEQFSCLHTGDNVTVLDCGDYRNLTDAPYFQYGAKGRSRSRPISQVCRIRVNPGDTIIL